jgi:UDP-3-O-[3-hydroxymyristoyl] glucosamine N-acyltransferase
MLLTEEKIMMITAKQIADLIEGKIEGNPEQAVSAPSGIEQAEPHHISFLANPKYENFLYITRAGIVLIDQKYELVQPVNCTLIRVQNVQIAVGSLLHYFQPKEQSTGYIHPSAVISDSVQVGEHVSIGAGSVIEENVVLGANVIIGAQVWIGGSCIIGEGTRIHPGVKIYPNIEIGKRCIIQANCVIGADGFGYSKDNMGVFTKVPQLGKVVLEDDVELGANTCVDRATMGVTRIGKGSKLDNLIHIAHNVSIGQNTGIAAQTGVAGSARIGNQCLIGGQVGIAGHISIADRSEIQAQSGIAGTIETPGQKWFGYPAIPYMDYVRSFTIFKKLPEIAKKIYAIEKKSN